MKGLKELTSQIVAGFEGRLYIYHGGALRRVTFSSLTGISTGSSAFPYYLPDLLKFIRFYQGKLHVIDAGP